MGTVTVAHGYVDVSVRPADVTMVVYAGTELEEAMIQPSVLLYQVWAVSAVPRRPCRRTRALMSEIARGVVAKLGRSSF